MEYDERDNEIVRLLSRLKGTGSSYPVALLVARRQRFVKQVATLGFGMVAAIALKETAKAAGGASIPSVASTILETALIVAIVAEAGFVAIVYRQRILDWFRTDSVEPAIEVISTFADADVPPVELPVTGPTLPAVVIETIEPTIAATGTPTIVITPSPLLPPVTVTVGLGDNSDNVQVNSTPQPHNNNGNHYGQTPKAERTRESGGGGGGSDRQPEATESDQNINVDGDDKKVPKK